MKRLLLLILPMGAAVYFFGFPAWHDCRNEMIKIISKDQSSQIVLFKRSCGATVTDSFHCSVFVFDQTLRDEDIGEIFIFEPSSDEQPPDIEFSSGVLTVKGKGRFFLDQKHHENIRVNYISTFNL